MPYQRKKFRASMRIHSYPSGNRVNVRYGNDLEQGLNEFFNEFLKERGFQIESCKGHVLVVNDGTKGHKYEFRAYAEASA
jgi:hypothetical protein